MIKPLFDNVVLKKEKIISETSSGIVLSTKEKESKYAKVVAIGDGHLANGKVIEMPINVGDKVYYKTYSPDTIKEDKEEYLIVSLSDIIGVVK
ncbi:MAG: co-chaperone GroES [Bacilli bacterium]